MFFNRQYHNNDAHSAPSAFSSLHSTSRARAGRAQLASRAQVAVADCPPEGALKGDPSRPRPARSAARSGHRSDPIFILLLDLLLI